MTNIQELKKHLKDLSYDRYERDFYDTFLENIKFKVNVPVILVAGSNGKGSVTNYLSHIYQHAGYKVGVYLSPYAYEVNEMISVNDININDDELLKIYQTYEDKFKKYDLSEFEIETIIAYSYFNQNNVDIAIVECGMGGALDATNIVSPILSIITNVSLEHTKYLGRSVSEIAANKAGIIPYEGNALLGKMSESAVFAIRETAKEEKAKITIVDDYHHEQNDGDYITFDYLPYKNLKINSSAFYEIENAALAIEATKILNDRFLVKEEDIYIGLSCKQLIGRFERLHPRIIVDGAHNPDAINKLVKSMENVAKSGYSVLFAAFLDKNIDLMLTDLSRDSNNVTITTFDHYRARKEDDYFLYLDDYKYIEDFKLCIDEFLANESEEILLITGSLAFAYQARKYILSKDIK